MQAKPIEGPGRHRQSRLNRPIRHGAQVTMDDVARRVVERKIDFFEQEIVSQVLVARALDRFIAARLITHASRLLLAACAEAELVV